jgi:hypothetical protein
MFDSIQWLQSWHLSSRLQSIMDCVGNGKAVSGMIQEFGYDRYLDDILKDLQSCFAHQSFPRCGTVVNRA